MKNAGLMVAALMAMGGAAFSDAPAPRLMREKTPEEKEAQMRRELAEVKGHKARLKAAAEKRQRKIEKRLKNMPSNV